MSSLYETHARLAKSGVFTIPLLGKRPFDAQNNSHLHGWLTPKTYEKSAFEHPITGLGVLLGTASGGLIDIDIDDVGLVDLALKTLPKTRAFGRNGQVRHLLYRCYGEPELPSKRWQNPVTNRVIFELRGDRSQTMLPPSVHPTGSKIQWLNNEKCHVLPYFELLSLCDSLNSKYLDFWGLPNQPPPRAPPPVASKHALCTGKMSLFERACRYVSRMPASVSGAGGHLALWRAACACVRFGLSDSESLTVLREHFNERCCDKNGRKFVWSTKELMHKITDARKNGRFVFKGEEML